MTTPSQYEDISYALVSPIMHEGSSFDIGHYYSYILYFNTGICWHYNDDEVTYIGDLTEGVYYRAHQKKSITTKNQCKVQNIYIIHSIYYN